MEWNCRSSSNFRRSVRLREVFLAPGTSKMCPLTPGVRLQEFTNVEFLGRNRRDRSFVSAYGRCLLMGDVRKRRFDCNSWGWEVYMWHPACHKRLNEVKVCLKHLLLHLLNTCWIKWTNVENVFQHCSNCWKAAETNVSWFTLIQHCFNVCKTCLHSNGLSISFDNFDS